MKPVLVSGIQPTGRLHIGNYLGALKNFVDLQNSGKYDCHYFIADLHSLTEDFDPKEKPQQILELAADFIAAGIDPKKSVLFQQSLIPAHTELAWILNTITPIGELERMTQFKDKGRQQQENINAGLFTYPTLMAADILLYDAEFVPVGDDQLQHLELTRTLARKFNARFPARRSLGEGGGKTFIEPQPLLTKTPRVMSLKNPEKKMSKSDPAGCLFLDDSPEDIKAKIARATTDSGSDIKYEEVKKPGISNLLGIYAALSGESAQTLERKFKGKTYSEFKTELAATVADHFADFRKKKKELLAKPNLLKQTLRRGSGRAAEVTARKIAEVKSKVGLIV